MPALIQCVDDRWRTAREIADISGLPRRGMSNTLDRLVREGRVERRRPPGKKRSSMWSDAPPRQYRKVSA